eukprot:tig00000459_g1076.t1
MAGFIAPISAAPRAFQAALSTASASSCTHRGQTAPRPIQATGSTGDRQEARRGGASSSSASPAQPSKPAWEPVRSSAASVERTCRAAREAVSLGRQHQQLADGNVPPGGSPPRGGSGPWWRGDGEESGEGGWQFVFSLLAPAAALATLLAKEAEAIPLSNVLKALENVPVFTITNAQGTPLTASSISGNKGRVGVFFINRLDAEQMLNKVRADNPSVGRTAKVTAVGLDKAYEIQRKFAKDGDKGEEVIFRFYPNLEQVKHAQNILKGQGKKWEPLHGVPVFQARGLTMRQDGDNNMYIPLFFTKEDMESAWREMRKSNPQMKATPDVEVGTLEAILKEMESDNAPHWHQVVFFAPVDSLNYIKASRGKGLKI